MASKVLVKLPSVPFPQGKKPPSDVVTLTDKNEGLNQSSKHQSINMDRVAQLEQNMKFLQEQHQATLVALHQEVESLRQQNRDLQFQLVFSKGSTYVPSSPSSPEDNGTGFVKSKGSPVCVNITPLQVELLEKDLQDTKMSLQEAKTQNQYLSDIIEELKKKLNLAEEIRETVLEGIQAGIRLPVRIDLLTCLVLAEGLIRQLHEQNEDQRKEIATLKAASVNPSNGNKGVRFRDSNNSHHSRGSPTTATQEQTSHKFPPLQSQSYWHRKTLRNGRNRHDKQQDHQSEMDSPVLPQVQNPSRGYRNYYREESNRKCIAQMQQKYSRDTDHHHHHQQQQQQQQQQQRHHRRDYRDGNSKNHQKEIADSADGSREADKSTGSKS